MNRILLVTLLPSLLLAAPALRAHSRTIRSLRHSRVVFLKSPLASGWPQRPYSPLLSTSNQGMICMMFRQASDLDRRHGP
jgi:hypothetical protein